MGFLVPESAAARFLVLAELFFFFFFFVGASPYGSLLFVRVLDPFLVRRVPLAIIDGFELAQMLISLGDFFFLVLLLFSSLDSLCTISSPSPYWFFGFMDLREFFFLLWLLQFQV